MKTFGGLYGLICLAVSVWMIYLIYKVAERVHAWPF